mgnify:CR=1 FL=1
MANLSVTNPSDLGVLVVGAGLSGLTLARRLMADSVKVTVFEKSRGVGGRLATRRGSGCLWDHGITSLDPAEIPPENYLDWKNLGVLSPRKDNPKLSWICCEGMTQLPKALEKGLDCLRHTKIDLIRIGPGGKVWMIRDESGGWHYGHTLVLAIPAPQALVLLDGSFPHQMVSLKESLLRIQYRPTLTLLAKINRRKYAQLNLKPEGAIETIVENGEKGLKDSEGALTIHMNEKFSRKHFESNEAEILAEVTTLFKKKYKIEFTSVELKKWRYSQVIQALEESYATAKLTSPLYVIGDGFCGGGIKGALLSANALADKILHPEQTLKFGREYGKGKKHNHCSK